MPATGHSKGAKSASPFVATIHYRTFPKEPSQQLAASRCLAQGPQPIFRKFLSLTDSSKGIIVLLVAAVGFSIMAALIKLAGARLHVTQILFVRQVVMCLILTPKIAANFPQSLQSGRPGLQLIRVGVALIAMLCGFSAVIHLPLADATAIGFAKSFFVTVFAIIILHETVGPRRWGATIVGFIGVAIMVQPGAGGFSLYSLYAVIGAAAAGLVMVIIRVLTRTEQPATIMIYQSFGVGLCMAIPAWHYWQTPTATEWMLLAGIGAVSFVSQLGNVFAYKWGEASMLATLEYTRLLYATALGFLLFGTLPGPYTLAGAVLIVSAAIYTMHREATLKRQKSEQVQKK